MMKYIYTFILFAIAIVAGAQTPTFTRDINRQYLSGSPANLYVSNKTIYFSGTTEYEGTELWKSDGTNSGTVMIKDIVAGTGSSTPERFKASGSLIFFVATDAINGAELWKTDGTAQGTALVKNINPGPAHGYPNYLTDVNGKLFFIATDTTAGTELWVTDGTESGTKLVKDIFPGKTSSNPQHLISYNGMLFFAATDDVNSMELWKSDGTETGTVLVKNIAPGNKSSFVNYPVVFNNRLYFVADDSTHGMELWKSDGTDTGTVIAADAYSGTIGSSPADLTVSGSLIYFSAASAAEGRELWKTDGTAGGTKLVKDLDAGTYSSSPQSLTNVNGKLFFTADVDYGRELYVSDGTISGTKLTRDLYPIQTDGQVNNLTAVGNTLFFTAHQSPDYLDIELFKSDGTGFGTTQVKNIASGTTASSPAFLVEFDGKLAFSADDYISGRELWISTGTASGTTMLKDVCPGTWGSNIKSMAATSSGVMFSAYEPTYGNEPWRSMGDSASTKLVRDIQSGNSSSLPNGFASVNGRVAFTANYQFSDMELYLSDATDTNAFNLNLGANYVAFKNITYFNGDMFFSRDGFAPGEIWIYKLGGGGGYRLKQFNISGLGDYTDNYTVAGKYMYFTADEGFPAGSRGNELWKTDGTSSGTQLVKDIYTGDGKDANPNNLAVLDTLLFFSATDGSKGYELWKTDGTSSGTVMVKDIYTGANGSGIQYMVAGNGVVYFTATNGSNGTELWVSDGTATGTKMVKDIVPGSAGSNPRQLKFVNKTLFFLLYDSINGEELWKSDGTDTGTMIVKDIYPGSKSSNIAGLTKVRNLLFFSANDSIHGQELWKTDGTTAGTVMLPEVFAGIQSSQPENLTLFGDTLYFTAFHPSYGNELWFLYTNCLYAGIAPATGCEGSSIQLKDASVDYGRTINDQWWEFGTGDTAVGANVNYKYTTAGTYTVTHRIRSTDGCEHTNKRTITVLGNPVVDFTVNDSTQCIGSNFVFQNNSTPITNTTSLWKFSDGTTSTTASPTKTFGSAGAKTAKLVVTVGGACKDSLTKNLTVFPSPATSLIVGKTTSYNKTDTFSVINTAGSTYVWTVTNGTQTSGGNTNSITVQWTNIPGTGTVKVVETNSNGCTGNPISKNVSLLKTASISDINGKDYFSIYPNPANTHISLNLQNLPAGGYILSVINILGQVIFTHEVKADEITEINTAQLAAGVYTLRISGLAGTFSQSLIITH